MIEAIIRLERMIPLGFCGSRPSRDVVAIHRTMGVVTALDRALTFPLSRTGFRLDHRYIAVTGGKKDLAVFDRRSLRPSDRCIRS
jgi:hypothetical protein